MQKLVSCVHCNGFMTPADAACPHCERPLPAANPATTKSGAGWLVGGLVALCGGAFAVTLMACYGLPPFKLRSAIQLIAFGRYERTNTQLDVPEQEIMQARQPGNDRSVYTAGLTLRPILEIAVKLDYQLRHSEVAGSTRHLLNCGIAYQF